VKHIYTSWSVVLSFALILAGIQMLWNIHTLGIIYLPYILLIWGSIQLIALRKNIIILWVSCFFNIISFCFFIYASILAFKDGEKLNGTGLVLCSLVFGLTGVLPLYKQIKRNT